MPLKHSRTELNQNDDGKIAKKLRPLLPSEESSTLLPISFAASSSFTAECDSKALRNRLAAQKSREKQKNYIKALEYSVTSLKSENSSLKTTILYLQDQVDKLISERNFLFDRFSAKMDPVLFKYSDETAPSPKSVTNDQVRRSNTYPTDLTTDLFDGLLEYGPSQAKETSHPIATNVDNVWATLDAEQKWASESFSVFSPSPFGNYWHPDDNYRDGDFAAKSAYDVLLYSPRIEDVTTSHPVSMMLGTISAKFSYGMMILFIDFVFAKLLSLRPSFT